MNWHLIKLILLLVSGYIAIGSLLVIFTSYISALSGGHFFDERGERWSHGDIPAAVVFWVWVLVIPAGFFYFLGKGWMKAIEYLSSKAIESGQMREKKLRGASTK